MLEEEGLLVSDEGMRVRFVTEDVKGPEKRYKHRSEGFSGCLAVTEKRLVCCTYGKCQINIALDDPKFSHLQVDATDGQSLSLSFESGAFREGWQGVMEFQFQTEKAGEFEGILKSHGACDGVAQ